MISLQEQSRSASPRKKARHHLACAPPARRRQAERSDALPLQQVTHYYFRGCSYYTPQDSDPFYGNIFFRQLTDITTGEDVPNMGADTRSPFWFPRQAIYHGRSAAHVAAVASQAQRAAVFRALESMFRSNRIAFRSSRESGDPETERGFSGFRCSLSPKGTGMSGTCLGAGAASSPFAVLCGDAPIAISLHQDGRIAPALPASASIARCRTARKLPA